jgi:hypothetical protein
MTPTTVLADDRYLVSYPRSGNTWLRFLLANLLGPEQPATFLDIEQRVPDIYKFDDAALVGMPGPRCLKSHEPFDHRYRRVAYLVRDPRAVAVSYFHFQRRVGLVPAAMPLVAFVGERFITGLAGFGRWDEHVAGWRAGGPGLASFKLVRYEDLMAKPAEVLRELATVVGAEGSPESAERAVAAATFSRMQELEKAAGDGWAGARRLALPNERFVRQGTTDGWRQTLDADSRALIEREFGATMTSMGYVAP